VELSSLANELPAVVPSVMYCSAPSSNPRKTTIAPVGHYWSFSLYCLSADPKQWCKYFWRNLCNWNSRSSTSWLNLSSRHLENRGSLVLLLTVSSFNQKSCSTTESYPVQTIERLIGDVNPSCNSLFFSLRKTKNRFLHPFTSVVSSVVSSLRMPVHVADSWTGCKKKPALDHGDHWRGVQARPYKSPSVGQIEARKLLFLIFF